VQLQVLFRWALEAAFDSESFGAAAGSQVLYHASLVFATK
jgi:hypothetical protein